MIFELKYYMQIDWVYIICRRVKWFIFKTEKILSLTKQQPYLNGNVVDKEALSNCLTLLLTEKHIQ